MDFLLQIRMAARVSEVSSCTFIDGLHTCLVEGPVFLFTYIARLKPWLSGLSDLNVLRETCLPKVQNDQYMTRWLG